MEDKYRHHKLELDEDGKIDMWAIDVDPDYDSFRGHNGPRCTMCGDYWCVHCEDKEPWLTEECEGPDLGTDPTR